MHVRRSLLSWLVAMVVMAVPARAGDKLEKDQKKWLDSVWAIMLPEEDKLYRDLKKDDRAEFQKIFWARRDPDLETPENEFQAGYLKQAAEADKRYRIAGRPGSTTDCGRVFFLLGEPSEVKQEQEEEESAGPRLPETWTYRDRPGMTFKSGQLRIGFDSECRLPQGARLGEQLARLAEARIVQPNIDYKRAPDGRLVKLVDLLPKPTPVQALLKAPRQDFALEAQPKLVMRGDQGATYVAILARGAGSELAVKDAGGRKQAALVVASQALDEAGKVAASMPEQSLSAEIAADGGFLASSALTLRPGRYTIRLAVLDSQSQKGSVASLPVEVPEFATGELSVSDVIVLEDVKEGVAESVNNSLAAFFLGSTQLVPRFGNVFAKSEALQLLALVYSAQTDPASGKPNCVAQFTILKDGTLVSSGQEIPVDSMPATPSVGPVPLQNLQPGAYVARLRLVDKLAQKEITKETSFEVKP